MKTKYIFWSSLVVISCIFLFSIREVLSPFFVSILIAYLLDPITNRLESYGVKRYLTVLIIVSLFFTILSLLLFILTPLFFAQIEQFIHSIPRYESFVIRKFADLTELFPKLDKQIATQLNNQLSSHANQALRYTGIIIKEIFQSGLTILNLLALIFFTPILVFYMLRDWPELKNHLKKLIPLKQKEIFAEQLNQIDKVLSAYIRGQLIVCLLLSIFYAITLYAIGLNYHLLIAIVSGLLNIIPFFGVVVGVIICAIVAFIQSSSIEYTFLVISIFTIGHLIEAYLIFPKLIGDKVGLHPLWIFFSLLAGSALFGFWGLLLAVPVAAIFGVLIKSLIKIYFSSKVYKN